MADWLALAFAGVCLAVWVGIALRNTRREIARTLARRPNPSRVEFVALMRPDVAEATAHFLWDTAMIYLQPRLTPHPDDDLVRDLPIDDGDWSMDWPREFADLHGFRDENYPDWPKGVPVTMRNFGKWLDLGLDAAQR